MDVKVLLSLTFLLAYCAGAPSVDRTRRSGHYCYHCTDASNNTECQHASLCLNSQNRCLTQMWFSDSGIVISKRCARMQTCYIYEENNPDACSNPDDEFEGYCSFCCDGSGCNQGLPPYGSATTDANDESEPDSKSAGGKSAGPGGKSAGPGGKSARPGGKSAGPGGKSAGPGGKSARPGGKSAGPGGKSAGPGGKSAGPGGKSARPGGKSAGPGGKSLGSKGSDGSKSTDCKTSGGKSSDGKASGSKSAGSDASGDNSGNCPPTKRPYIPIPHRPKTQPPATQPPPTQPPATQAPATQPPATQPPATQPPATNPPQTQAQPAQNRPPQQPNNVVPPCHCHAGQPCYANHSPNGQGGNQITAMGSPGLDVSINLHIGGILFGNAGNQMSPAQGVPSCPCAQQQMNVKPATTTRPTQRKSNLH